MTLAVIGGRVSVQENRLFAHVSFGKIIEAFAVRYKHVYLSAPLNSRLSSEQDYLLPDNVTLLAQPNWTTTLNSFKHLGKIKASYRKVINAADHVFVRGNPVAATAALYRYCTILDKPVCHWLVGNPMALLKSHKRSNLIKDALGKFYIWLWEKQLMRGRARSDGSFICNGEELAVRFASPKTIVTVSTTLSPDDFFEREDTCQGDTINILSLCFIRPEKGLEYLIEAFAQLKPTNKTLKLVLAGGRDRYQKYQQKLDQLVIDLGIESAIHWPGHIKYQDVPELMRQADLFVLPTLSEGTPRALVEARANSLPLIATNVGGIPTSVTDSFDGFLVPPKDSSALAEAILKLINNSKLRRQFIKNGYNRAKDLTTDSFVLQVIGCLTDYRGHL